MTRPEDKPDLSAYSDEVRAAKRGVAMDAPITKPSAKDADGSTNSRIGNRALPEAPKKSPEDVRALRLAIGFGVAMFILLAVAVAVALGVQS